MSVCECRKCGLQWVPQGPASEFPRCPVCELMSRAFAQVGRHKRTIESLKMMAERIAARRREILRGLEWSDVSPLDRDLVKAWCPECGRHIDEGHTHDCALWAEVKT